MRWPDGDTAVRPFAFRRRLCSATAAWLRIVSATMFRARLATGRSILPASKAEWEDVMTDSVYKVIELVGTSKESWEKAASTAVERAAKTLRDLRVAEVVKLDMQLDAKGKVEAYRAKINVSFKFEGT
jgi:flavin-binding protein dodecin